MHELTKRQKQILNFIEKQLAAGEPFPSYSEIGQRFGITKPGVARHITALEKKGFVSRHQQRQSAFTITPSETPEFPLVARIAAGAPVEAFEQSDESLSLNGAFFGSNSLIALEVSGDSMTGDFIADGDIVLVRLQQEFDQRHIFAVRVQGEITLKRLKRKGNWIELIPSNPDYPIQKYPASEVEVLGKLKGSVRKY